MPAAEMERYLPPAVGDPENLAGLSCSIAENPRTRPLRTMRSIYTVLNMAAAMIGRALDVRTHAKNLGHEPFC